MEQEGQNMSECVVRMEMPENCFVCPFRLGCYTYRAYSFSTSTRRVLPKPLDEGCNILAVLPENHGRLVDAEILKAKLIEHIAETNGFYNAFNETPTIVPADTAERSE